MVELDSEIAKKQPAAEGDGASQGVQDRMTQLEAVVTSLQESAVPPGLPRPLDANATSQAGSGTHSRSNVRPGHQVHTTTENGARSQDDDWLGQIPLSERKYARMGNLGWDAPADQVLVQAKKVLEDAGVNKDDFSCLSAARDKGSIVSLTFNSAELLQDTKRKIRSLKIKAPGCEIFVWLDVEKSRNELRPARLIHRGAEALSNQEDNMSEPLEVTKRMNGKQIKVGNRLAMWTLYGKLQWSKWAQNRYGEEDIEAMSAFIQN